MLITTLLLAALCGSASVQDKIVIAKIPQSAHDLSRDPSGTKLSTATTAGTGAANSTVLSAEFKKAGYGASAHVAKPFFVPAGRYLITNGVTIGVGQDGVTPIAGGQFLGAGGTTAVAQEAHFASGGQVGNVTRFTYDGSRDDDQYLFRFVGREWYIGPLELHGIRLVSAQHRTDRDTDVLFEKCPAGLRIEKILSGFENGQLCGDLKLMGFDRGIEVVDTNENHCDRLRWSKLSFDTCNTGYYVDNDQSVSHYVDWVECTSFVDTLFHFVQGGDFHCRAASIVGATTILKIDDTSTGWNGYEMRNIRIDNNATGSKLLEMGAFTGVPRIVVMTGTIGNGVTLADPPITGQNVADILYFRFYDEGGEMSEVNDLSTVDAPPF